MITVESSVSSVDVDRRHNGRIELLGEIKGQVMPFALPVVLLDLSDGGFAITSPVPFKPNSEYTFQFNGTRRFGPIRAKDVHCLRVSHGTSSVSYVAGFSFVLKQPSEKQIVDDLLAEARGLIRH